MEKKLTKIGFIGLGSIGAPMSRALLRAGFNVTVCDKFSKSLKPFIADGVAATQKPFDLANSEMIIVMVATDDQVKEVFSGTEGFLEAVDPTSPPLVAIMSTIMPQTTLELAPECAVKNVRLLDATVSGLPPVAEKGKLTIMVGGEEADLEAARPVFEALGQNIFHCGPLGTGDTTKLVNNIIGVTNLYLTVEAMAVGMKLGMDPYKLAEILEQSSGRNMSTRDWGNGRAIFDLFSQSLDMSKVMIDLSRKDLSHAQELARSVNIDVPLLDHIIKAIDNFTYEEIKERWHSVV
jgi:3-hydroxyisobutyrate dehydrogenase